MLKISPILEGGVFVPDDFFPLENISPPLWKAQAWLLQGELRWGVRLIHDEN